VHLTNEHQIFSYHLGQVVENLQSLEATLRIVLSEGHGPDPFKLQAGQQVPETVMTTWASLSELIRKFNKIVSCEYHLDEDSIVSLRDALVHGFTLIKHSDSPTRLIKFGKPMNGMVPVEIAVDMTSEWLAEQRKTTFEAFGRIVAYTKDHPGLIEIGPAVPDAPPS